jgi:rod shape-determining protein MreC
MADDVRLWWGDYFALQQVRADNIQMKQELAELRIRLQQERGLAEQSRTLQTLLTLKTSTALPTTAASVIAGGASPEFRTITIDKGTSEGLGPDMAVIAPAGVVGRIILPTGRASKVQLLIDRNAAAGAIIERTRAQGVAIGSGAEQMRMDYVSGSADVKAGDTVVTSGIDGIYPKGFVIGQIESVHRGAGVYSAIVIRPAVDFSALEAVLVVKIPAAAAPDAVAAPGSNQDHE